ncbi:hypothetical protein OROHE_000030 [Orobanche hederae]
MASSQTSSHSQKMDQINDGRLFSRSTVLNRIISEVEYNDCMERIISKIEEQGLYRLGSSHTETYDELIVEEFYRDATVKSHSRKHGGAVISISASVYGIAICINQELLETMFGLPSDCLTMEELESFGSDELLTAYWGLFTGKSSNKDVHPSCPKKKFCLPFVFLHDFCCRIIENRTGAFDTCTNLRFRMIIAILYGERVNWSQIVLKRLSEEVSKPHSQKKSFGLLLNNILTRSGVRQSKHAKKIGSGKYVGGYKPSAYHQAGPTANRPFLNLMPSAKNPRGTSKKTSTAEDKSSKKRKRSVSESKSPLTDKKKHKKASKSKARGTVTDPVTITDVPVTITDVPAAQPADYQTQGETPAVESTSRPVDPKPTASNDQIFADLENLNESITHMESFVSSLVRAPIPEQDPTRYRVPSPSRDPTHNRVPTPVRDSSMIQDPTPVEDPVHTVNSIPVKSPSPSAKSLSDQVEQAFTRFIQWKSYRTAPYDVLFNWKEWKEEEQFILDVTDSKEILLLILMENDQCKELIFSHFLVLNDPESLHPVQPDSTPVPVAISEEISRDIPREDLVPLPEQSEAERQQEPAPTPFPLSSEPEPSHIASSSFRRPESPRSEARKEQLNALERQSLFIQDAVEALYQVGKEMDWLNLTASEEMESVNVELTKIAEAFSTLPQDLKEAFAKFQHLEEQSLLEEQSKLRTVESKMVAVLEYTDSRISDHDAKIFEMAKVISSFDDKLSKFEEQQDNVLKVFRSIDHTVSELNARKGEGHSDSSREPAHRRPDQARRSKHESTSSLSSRPEHQHRI